MSKMKWVLALGVGVVGGWAIRSLSDTPEGAGVKLLEIGIKTKDRVGRWAAVEGERLEDMLAEARSRVEPEFGGTKTAAKESKRSAKEAPKESKHGARGGSMSRSEKETILRNSHSESGEGLRHKDAKLRLVHFHPGYLRIQADAFIHAADDSPLLTGAKAAAGFSSWSLKPKTGSVVIEYDNSMIEADDLLKDIAKGAGLRTIDTPASRHMTRDELVSRFLNGVQGVNQSVSHLTGDRADLRELTPLALAAASIVALILNKNRGLLPFWSSSLYHSYRVFMQWHKKEVGVREKAARHEEERGSGGNALIQ